MPDAASANAHSTRSTSCRWRRSGPVARQPGVLPACPTRTTCSLPVERRACCRSAVPSSHGRISSAGRCSLSSTHGRPGHFSSVEARSVLAPCPLCLAPAAGGDSLSLDGSLSNLQRPLPAFLACAGGGDRERSGLSTGGGKGGGGLAHADAKDFSANPSSSRKVVIAEDVLCAAVVGGWDPLIRQSHGCDAEKATPKQEWLWFRM